MKRIFGILFALMLAVVSMLAVAAQDITVTLDGKIIDFKDVEPQIIDSRTMVPLRAIFEALQADVEWDDATKTATSTRGDITVSIKIGDGRLIKNGQEIALDVPAQIVDSRTLVPVRAISESFGCKVEWDDAAKTVIIVSVSAQGDNGSIVGSWVTNTPLDALVDVSEFVTDEIKEYFPGLDELEFDFVYTVNADFTHSISLDETAYKSVVEQHRKIFIDGYTAAFEDAIKESGQDVEISELLEELMGISTVEEFVDFILYELYGDDELLDATQFDANYYIADGMIYSSGDLDTVINGENYKNEEFAAIEYNVNGDTLTFGGIAVFTRVEKNEPDKDTENVVEPQENSLLGRWAYEPQTVDLHDIYIELLGISPKAAHYFDGLKNIIVGAEYEFYGDMTFDVFMDTYDVYNQIYDVIESGVKAYISDVMKQNNVDLDELLTDAGVEDISFNYISNIRDSEIFQEMDEYYVEGCYFVEDGKVYMSQDLQEEVTNKNFRDYKANEFAIDGDILVLDGIKLTKVNNRQIMGEWSGTFKYFSQEFDVNVTSDMKIDDIVVECEAMIGEDYISLQFYNSSVKKAAELYSVQFVEAMKKSGKAVDNEQEAYDSVVEEFLYWSGECECMYPDNSFDYSYAEFVADGDKLVITSDWFELILERK